jgi:hypothetical protein
MAKLSANGAHAVAQSAVTPWDDGYRRSYILRSDGAVLRKHAFKHEMHSGRPYYTSSMQVIGRYPKTMAAAAMLEAFRGFVVRHGLTLEV